MSNKLIDQISSRNDFTTEELQSHWIETYTQVKFPICNPKPRHINLTDIAHSLSRLCRWNGHTDTFYSVGAHCNVMAYIMIEEENKSLAKQALFHDASEAYISDIPQPVKRCLKTARDMEGNILKTIFQKYECPPEIHPSIHQLDRRMVRLEKEEVIKGDDWPWLKELKPIDFDLEGYVKNRSMEDIKNEYLTLAKKLLKTDR